MKKKLLLILALTLVVITVVAGLTACKNQADLLDIVKQNTVTKTLVNQDITATLADYTVDLALARIEDARSYVMRKGTGSTATLDIVVLKNDGTVGITSLGYADAYTVTTATATIALGVNVSYYIAYNSAEGVEAPYSVYDAYGTKLFDAKLDTYIAHVVVAGTVYLFDRKAGDLYTLDTDTMAGSAVVTAEGVAINVLEDDCEFYVLASVSGVVKAGDYFIYEEQNSGFVYYSSTFERVQEVRFDYNKYDSTKSFILNDGTLLIQGAILLPEDATDYDVYTGGDKFSYETMAFTLDYGDWWEETSFDGYKIETIAIVDEDSAYQNCDNIIEYYLIEDYHINTSKKYTATLSNDLSMGYAILPSSDYEVTGVLYAGENIVVTLTNLADQEVLEVYNIDGELLATVKSSSIAGWIDEDYYVTNDKMLKSLSDTSWSMDLEGYHYSHMYGYVFDKIGPAGVSYTIFNPATKEMTFILQDVDANLVSSVEVPLGQYVQFNYVDGTTAFYTMDGTEILARGNYDFINGLIYTSNAEGKVSMARALYAVATK